MDIKVSSQQHFKQANWRTVSGFTLLEVMLALLIFAIIAMITTLVLHSVMNARKSSEHYANRLAKLQVAVTLIEQDFSQIINRPIVLSGDIRQAAVLGNVQQIEFTRTAYPNPFAKIKQSNLQRVRYQFKNQQLFRQTWARLDRLNNQTNTNTLLLNGVSNFSLKYLTQQNTFVNYWPLKQYTSSKADALPKAIQIQFDLKNWGSFNLTIPIPAATHIGNPYAN